MPAPCPVEPASGCFCNTATSNAAKNAVSACKSAAVPGGLSAIRIAAFGAWNVSTIIPLMPRRPGSSTDLGNGYAPVFARDGNDDVDDDGDGWCCDCCCCCCCCGDGGGGGGSGGCAFGCASPAAAAAATASLSAIKSKSAAVCGTVDCCPMLCIEASAANNAGSSFQKLPGEKMTQSAADTLSTLSVDCPPFRRAEAAPPPLPPLPLLLLPRCPLHLLSLALRAGLQKRSSPTAMVTLPPVPPDVVSGVVMVVVKSRIFCGKSCMQIKPKKLGCVCGVRLGDKRIKWLCYSSHWSY